MSRLMESLVFQWIERRYQGWRGQLGEWENGCAGKRRDRRGQRFPSGASRLHPVSAVGEWTELALTYEVGGVGVADGAWLKLAYRFYSDWALFQTSDPSSANYVWAEHHAASLLPGQSPATAQALKVRFDQKGHQRPFQKAVIVDVVDSYLNPGDRIVIRLGDRRNGGPGTRVQTFVEKNFRFRMFIDPLGSSNGFGAPLCSSLANSQKHRPSF